MIAQAVVFSLHVVLVLAVFGWVGLSLVRLLPAPLASRPVYSAAPLGFTLATTWMGVLTELGVTGGYSGGTLLLAATVANALQAPSALRAMATTPRGSVARPLAITLGLTLLACAVSSFMAFRDSEMHFGDPWGSGDYFYYWFAGDYIAELGGAPAQALLQQRFSHDLAGVLFLLSFRPGSYAPLDLFLGFGPSGAVDRFLLPLLTADVVLILLALRLLLELHQVRWVLPLLLVALSPLNYFGVRFSYVAQYAGVALLVFAAAGLDALTQAGPHRRAAPWMVGLLLAAGVLSYDNQLFPVGLLVAGHATLQVLMARGEAGMSWKEALRRAARVSAIPIAVVTGTALAFSPRILSGLRLFASLRPLPGWEWTRLPRLEDILGFRGFYPVPEPALPLWVEVALFIGAAGLCWLAWRRRLRSAAAVSALVAQTAQLIIALLYYRAGIGNASHAVWKSVSLFALLVPLLCAVGVLELGERWRGRAWRLASVALLLVAAGVQLRALWVLPPVGPWFDRSLVELVRAHMEQRDLFVPLFDPQHIIPVVRRPESSRVRVVEMNGRVLPRCTPEGVAIWDARKGEGGTVMDSAGHYRLGLPPRELDFPAGRGQAWVLWGLWPQGDGSQQLVESTAAILLGAPGPELELTARVLNSSRPARVKVAVDGIPLGEAVFEGAEPSTQRFAVPAEVLERCRSSFASIRLEPAPGTEAPAGVSSTLGVMRLAFR
ncbi:hypothetical protein [Hyalangium gracile]|uniref:hypothetical protein n=1 Tax=Hyalangium gracile TaxID=394092 RepID=UPI001CC96F4F|nr:hypothetical protein [Hyalangium gracile]